MNDNQSPENEGQPVPEQQAEQPPRQGQPGPNGGPKPHVSMIDKRVSITEAALRLGTTPDSMITNELTGFRAQADQRRKQADNLLAQAAVLEELADRLERSLSRPNIIRP